MSDIREDRKYTREDDWLKEEGENIRLGITDYAQENLGEIVNVELLKGPGDRITKGEEIAFVESIKATADIHAPFDGVVVEANESLLDDNMEYVGKFNEAPFDEWMYLVKPDGPLEGLLTPEEYREHRS